MLRKVLPWDNSFKLSHDIYLQSVSQLLADLILSYNIFHDFLDIFPIVDLLLDLLILQFEVEYINKCPLYLGVGCRGLQEMLI